MNIGSLYPRCQWSTSQDHPLRKLSLLRAARELIKSKAADKAAEMPPWASSSRTKALESIVADKHGDAINARRLRAVGEDVAAIVGHVPAQYLVAAHRQPSWGRVVSYSSLGWDESRRDYRRSCTFEDGSVLTWGQNDERGSSSSVLFGRAAASVVVIGSIP